MGSASAPGTSLPRASDGALPNEPAAVPWQWRAMVQAAPGGMALVGLDGRFLSVNGVLCWSLPPIRLRNRATRRIGDARADQRNGRVPWGGEGGDLGSRPVRAPAGWWPLDGVGAPGDGEQLASGP